MADTETDTETELRCESPIHPPSSTSTRDPATVDGWRRPAAEIHADLASPVVQPLLDTERDSIGTGPIVRLVRDVAALLAAHADRGEIDLHTLRRDWRIWTGREVVGEGIPERHRNARLAEQRMALALPVLIDELDGLRRLRGVS